MSELILTDDEKAAISWLDMTDDALGKLVRNVCIELPKMLQDESEIKKIWIASAAMTICNMAADSNSEKTTFTFNGLKLKDKEQGDWKILIKKLK